MRKWLMDAATPTRTSGRILHENAASRESVGLEMVSTGRWRDEWGRFLDWHQPVVSMGSYWDDVWSQDLEITDAWSLSLSLHLS